MALSRRQPRAARSLLALPLALAVLAGPAAAQRSTASSAPAADQAAITEATAHYVQPPAPIAEFFARDPNFADARRALARRPLLPGSARDAALHARADVAPHLPARRAGDPAGDRPALASRHLRDRRAAHLRPAGAPLPRRGAAARAPSSATSSGRRTARASPSWRTSRRGTEVWTADAGHRPRAQRFSDARVLATLGTEAQVDIAPGRRACARRACCSGRPRARCSRCWCPPTAVAEPRARPGPGRPDGAASPAPKPTPTRTYSNLLQRRARR